MQLTNPNQSPLPTDNSSTKETNSQPNNSTETPQPGISDDSKNDQITSLNDLEQAIASIERNDGDGDDSEDELLRDVISQELSAARKKSTTSFVRGDELNDDELNEDDMNHLKMKEQQQGFIDDSKSDISVDDYNQLVSLPISSFKKNHNKHVTDYYRRFFEKYQNETMFNFDGSIKEVQIEVEQNQKLERVFSSAPTKKESIDGISDSRICEGTDLAGSSEQIADPFVKECLHLFNGEWNVLKSKNESIGKNSNTKDVLPLHEKYIFTDTKANDNTYFNIFKNEKFDFDNNSISIELEKTLNKYTTRYISYLNNQTEEQQQRTLYHPLTFFQKSQINIFVKCHSLHIGASSNEVEPLFCSIQVFNIEKKTKLSEKYYFHLNSYTVLNDFFDDVGEKKKMLRFQKEEAPPRSIFSLSFGSDTKIKRKKQNSEDTVFEDFENIEISSEDVRNIYLVLWVEKTFNAQSHDSIQKLYTTSVDSSSVENNMLGLKKYKQPFVWAFAPLFKPKEENTFLNTQLSPNSHKIQRNSLVPKSTSPSNRRKSLILKGANNLIKRNSVALRTNESFHSTYSLHNDLLEFNHLYPAADLNGIEDALSIINLYSSYQDAGYIIKTPKHIKHFKKLPGFCLMEVRPFNPIQFEKNIIEREYLVGETSDDQDTVFNQFCTDISSAKQTVKDRNAAIRKKYLQMEKERREIEQEKQEKQDEGDRQNEEKEEEEEELDYDLDTEENKRKEISNKQYLNYQKSEFISDEVSAPFISFTHQLYVYPKFADFSGVKPVGQKIKPRNILLEITYMENTQKHSHRIVVPYEKEPQSTHICSVLFDQKKPYFFDEIKLILPLHVDLEQHLLFTFFHLSVEKSVSKRRKTIMDNSVPRVFLGFSYVRIKEVVEASDANIKLHLPIYKQMVQNYLSDSNNETMDIKKNHFEVSFSLLSTINPKEPLISSFFKDCSPILNAVSKDGKISDRFIMTSAQAADSALKQITKVSFKKVLPHLPLIMNMLFTIMCRVIDLLSKFTSQKEESHLLVSQDSASSSLRKSRNRGSVVSRRRFNSNNDFDSNAPSGSLEIQKNERRSRAMSVFRKSVSQPKSGSPSSPETSNLPLDENFNLVKYLESQKQAETANPPPEDKKKKRFSIFRKRSHSSIQKKAVSEQAKASEKIFSPQTSVSSVEHTLNQNFSDFLGFTNTALELRSLSFKAIIFLLKGAGSRFDDSSRDNPLLASYVQFIYKNVLTSSTPVCYAICELWNELLASGDMSDLPDFSKASNPIPSNELMEEIEKSNDLGALQKALQNFSFDGDGEQYQEPKTLRRKNSYKKNISAFKTGKVPLFYETLQFSWFFLDIMLKSYITMETEDDGSKLFATLRELVDSISDKIIHEKTLPQLASDVNIELATFLRDIISEKFKMVFIFKLVEIHLSKLYKMKNRTLSVRLKLEFFSVFSMHSQFASLNNIFICYEYETNEDEEKKYQLVSNPLLKLLMNIVDESLKASTKNELFSSPRIQGLLADTLCVLCKRFDSSRIDTQEEKSLYATLLLPYLKWIVANTHRFSVLENSIKQQHVQCLLWILVNLSDETLGEFISFHEQFTPWMVFALESIKTEKKSHINMSMFRRNPSNQQKHSNPKHEENCITLTVLQVVVAKLLKAKKSRVSKWINYLSNNKVFIQRETSLLSIFDEKANKINPLIKESILKDENETQNSKEERDKNNLSQYYTTLLVYLICRMIQLLEESKVVMIPSLYLEIEDYLTDVLSDYFNSSPHNTYFNWIYGTLISNVDIETNLHQTVSLDAYHTYNNNTVIFARLISCIHDMFKERQEVSKELLEKALKRETEEDSSENVVFETEEDKEDTPEVSVSTGNMIKGATLDKLIEKITESNVEKMETFFLTYRSFSNPNEILSEFIARLKKKEPQEGEQIDTNSRLVSIRVVNCLRHWVQEHFYDFDCSSIITIYNFLNNSAQHSKLVNKKITNPILQKLVSRLMYTNRNNSLDNIKTAEVSMAEPAPKPILPSQIPYDFGSFDKFPILHFDAVEIARQICLIEFEIFSRIQPKECFKSGWSKKDKKEKSPNIVQLIERFNYVSNWVATTIVSEPDLKKRSLLLKHFINIGDELRKLNNFNAMNSIISGLNNAAVYRLSKTKSTLKKKNEISLSIMNELVSTQGSYKLLRKAVLESGEQPCVPYIGIYLTDLTFVEDGNPDYLKNGLINYLKRKRVAKVIEGLRIHQQKQYNFKIVSVLYSFLETIESEKFHRLFLEDKQLYKQSLLIEPRT